jgi:GMP synthase-like glutamine amidotransferase
VGDALVAAGVTLEVCRVWDGDAVPTTSQGLAGVVVMGGAMSAGSDDGFPARGAELALLRHAVAQQVPVLGVCLGAQLLAAAGGAPVYPGESGLELGWVPVGLEEGSATDPLFSGLPRQLTVLNWHGDTFDLPDGAVRLASGATYPNQAFRLGERAWGVQFHIEVDVAAVDCFIDAFPEEAVLADGGGSGLRAAGAAALPALRPSRSLILTRFAALVASGRI